MTTLERTAAVLLLDGSRLLVDAERMHASVDDTTIDASSLIDLRARLAATIYAHLHIRNPGIADAPPLSDDGLTEALIAAIEHRTVEQPVAPGAPGLATVQGEDRRAVEIGGVRVLVPPRELIHRADGSVAGVRLPSWRTRTTPGYLLALGPSGLTPADRVARLYIAADDPAETLALWGRLLAALTGHRYQAKALSDARAYPRSDAIVLYLPAADVHTVAARIRPLLDALPPARTAPSAFARRLSARLAHAEDPADSRPSYGGLSFGQHRSRVLAEALIRASTEGIPAPIAWAEGARAAGFDARPEGHHELPAEPGGTTTSLRGTAERERP